MKLPTLFLLFLVGHRYIGHVSAKPITHRPGFPYELEFELRCINLGNCTPEEREFLAQEKERKKHRSTTSKKPQEETTTTTESPSTTEPPPTTESSTTTEPLPITENQQEETTEQPCVEEKFDATTANLQEEAPLKPNDVAPLIREVYSKTLALAKKVPGADKTYHDFFVGYIPVLDAQMKKDHRPGHFIDPAKLETMSVEELVMQAYYKRTATLDHRTPKELAEIRLESLEFLDRAKKLL